MKTMIAVPCMDMMHTQFVHSLIGLRMTEEYRVTFAASSLIYDSRNQLLKQAIEGGFDRLLWFDSDMTFDPHILDLLNEDLDKGFDIVSGLYFKRKAPYTPVLYKVCDTITHENGAIEPINEVYTDYPQNTVFDVAAFGFGCVMMNLETVKKIVEQYGLYLFMPVAGFGEDLSFCLRARSAGFHIYCDSRVKLGHVGNYVYNESVYLTRQGATHD